MNKITVILIILFLIVGAFAFMQGVFKASPLAVGHYLVAQVGSGIGVTVSIPPNPFNTLAQQLKEKEEYLLKKEAGLQQKELALEEQLDKTQNNQSRTFVYLLLTAGILLVLIFLNLYLYRRKEDSEFRI